MNINIDINKLNAAVAKAYPEYDAKLAAKAEKTLDPTTKAAMVKAVGFAGIPDFIDDAALSFCNAWPKVRPVLNAGLRFASWVPGMSKYIALAKAVMAAINDEIVPAICGPQK